MDRAAFYASVRSRTSGIFGNSLSQKQVEGVEAILDEADKRGTSIFHLAAIMAEAYHETGGQMQPVKETVYASSKDRNPPDAVVIARLEKAFKDGKLPWVKTPYWRDGWFGRGLIQLTHKANYDKFGVTKQSALDLKTSVRVMFDGMEKGLFTGRKLSDYDVVLFVQPPIPSFKYYASRAIVNGDMAANGAKIDAYGKAFEAALCAAGYAPQSTTPKPIETSVSSPKTEAQSTAPAKANWLVNLLQSLAALFKRK